MTKQQLTSEQANQTIEQIIKLDAILTANPENYERIESETIKLIRRLRQRLSKYTKDRIEAKIGKFEKNNPNSKNTPLDETIYIDNISNISNSGIKALRNEIVRFSKNNDGGDLSTLLDTTKLNLDLIDRNISESEKEIKRDEMEAKILSEVETARELDQLLRESKSKIYNDAKILQNLGSYVFMPTTRIADMTMWELEDIRDSIVFSSIEYRD